MSEERTSADAVVEEIPVQEEDFAALLEKESKMPERLEPGQRQSSSLGFQTMVRLLPPPRFVVRWR